MVVNNVKSKDLGVYECRVDNEIGTENVTIELTYVPEPPKLKEYEREGDSVITHWHIRSMQPLKEIMLNYQLKGVGFFVIKTSFCNRSIKQTTDLLIYLCRCRKRTGFPKQLSIKNKAKNTLAFGSKFQLKIEMSINSTISKKKKQLFIAESSISLLYHLVIGTFVSNQ